MPLDSSLEIASPALGEDMPPAQPAASATGFLTANVKRAIGNASLRLNSDSPTPLPNIPTGAQSAIFVIEAAPNTQGTVLARFWSDGTWPDTISGLPCYDGSPIEIIGSYDVNNTRIFSADGLNHKINVQYYSGS